MSQGKTLSRELTSLVKSNVLHVGKEYFYVKTAQHSQAWCYYSIECIKFYMFTFNINIL